MLQINVAEQPNAVKVKPFDDLLRIGGAIEQIVVVVVRLKHVQQHIRVRLTLESIGHCRLKPRVSIHKEWHDVIPIPTEQQMGVVPSTTDDLTVSVHLPYDVLRVHFGLRIVATDAVVVFRVEALSNLCDVGQGHGPEIGIPLVHGPIREAIKKRLVKEVVDRMAVFMVHHIGNQ